MRVLFADVVTEVRMLERAFALKHGYHLEATLEIFETWADGRTELSTAPTA